MNRKCPVCENFNESIHTLQFTEFHKLYGLPEFYPITICQNCALAYAAVNSSQDIYDKYYMDRSFYKGKSTLPNVFDEAHRFSEPIKFLQRFLSKTREDAILDVGAGGGIY